MDYTTHAPSAAPSGDVLDRYLARETTPAETARVEQWLAQSPRRLAVIQAIRNGRPGDIHQPVDPVQEWARFARKRDRNNSSASGTSALWRPWYAVGAAIIVILGISTVWPVIQRLATGSPGVSVVSNAREYSTSRGQRALFELPDGSRVILGADTRLAYAETAAGVRTVTLAGQAYFTVMHDPARTFTVTTGNAKSRVLGTAFGVRAYPGDTGTDVTVAEGKIELATPTMRTIVPAGTGGHASVAGVVTTQSSIPVDEMLGWTRGEFAFRDAPFHVVARELERLYDIHIQFGDAQIANRRMTVVLRDEPVDEMLRTLAPVVDARYTRSARTVVFYAK